MVLFKKLKFSPTQAYFSMRWALVHTQGVH